MGIVVSENSGFDSYAGSGVELPSNNRGFTNYDVHTFEIDVTGSETVGFTLEMLDTDVAISHDGVWANLPAFGTVTADASSNAVEQTFSWTFTLAQWVGAGSPAAIEFEYHSLDSDEAATGDNAADTDSFIINITCYGAGSLIATALGETKVEDLRIGDLITTASGHAVAVKWVGRQSVKTRMADARMEPVKIKQGALGPDVPHSDLTVTADHGMIVDGMVINAAALVNGHSIDWVALSELPDEVTYYHIETEFHDQILANGAPAETFVDAVTRANFDNYQEYVDLYGFERIIPEMDRPRIASRRLVPDVVKTRLGISDKASHIGNQLTG